MPNKHAAIKDLRKNRRHARHNARIKANVKLLFKQSKDLLKEGNGSETQKLIRAFQQAVDKAAKRGVLHKNKAGRKKSELMKKLTKKS